MSDLVAYVPVELTETAWVPQGAMDFDQWEAAGRELQRMGRAWQWWVGDWLNYGERAYGEKYTQAIETGPHDLAALQNAAWVAAAIEPSTRVEGLSWTHHREVAKLAPAEQAEWLDAAKGNDWTTRELRMAVREATRPPSPALPPGQYAVLYVDPPWRYEGAETPDAREIENHYQTMTLEELKGLDIPAADDAVMFMWATSPKLDEALDLLDTWGFQYRTCMVWVKDKIGMGYYARQQHEVLLIGRCGDPGVPAETDRPSSVIAAPRGQHSAKPEEAYEAIERMYPDLPRVELFARGPRDGWASWGNEAEAA